MNPELDTECCSLGCDGYTRALVLALYVKAAQGGGGVDICIFLHLDDSVLTGAKKNMLNKKVHDF